MLATAVSQVEQPIEIYTGLVLITICCPGFLILSIMSGTKSPAEDIALPVLSKEKDFDFSPAPPESNQNTLLNHNSKVHTETLDGAGPLNTDTDDTHSSDEFNWDEDDDARSVRQQKKARRGRAVYMACMRLARPVRVMLICFLGSGVLIAPLLVFQLRFKNSAVTPHVFAWSLWLAVVWAAACLTYAIVDMVPRLIIRFVILFGGHVERLKMQIEVWFPGL